MPHINKSRIAGKPENYSWSKSDALFRHKKNGRFLSNKQARSIGLKIPATQPESIAPLATTPVPVPEEKKTAAAILPTADIAPLADAPAAASQPDSEIFGNLPPEPEKPATDENKTDSQSEANAETDSEPQEETTAEDHRGLATGIWDGAVGILSGLIGRFWQPRPVGSDPQKNEIPYDERELVIVSFCAYFKHIGMAIMSPVQNLWLAIFTYASPRLHETIMVIKIKWFTKRAQPGPQTPPGDTRMPPPAPDKTPPAQPGAQQPAPHAAPVTSETQAIILRG